MSNPEKGKKTRLRPRAYKRASWRRTCCGPCAQRPSSLQHVTACSLQGLQHVTTNCPYVGCLDFLILYIYISYCIIHDAKSLFGGENDNKDVDLTVFSDEPWRTYLGPQHEQCLVGKGWEGNSEWLRRTWKIMSGSRRITWKNDIRDAGKMVKIRRNRKPNACREKNIWSYALLGGFLIPCWFNFSLIM